MSNQPIGQMTDTPDMVERFARAMFDEWPLHAISPAMAEQSGQEVGSPLSWDKVLEMGGNHDGLLRLARGAVKQHSTEQSAHIARLTSALRGIVGNANEAMPMGPFDCIDNTGQPYQSEEFYIALKEGRDLLATLEALRSEKGGV